MVCERDIHLKLGHSEGVGFSVVGGVDRQGEGVFVSTVDPDSAAERAGVYVGAEVTHIAGESVQTFSRAEVIEELGSAEGEFVFTVRCDHVFGMIMASTLSPS